MSGLHLIRTSESCLWDHLPPAGVKIEQPFVCRGEPAADSCSSASDASTPNPGPMRLFKPQTQAGACCLIHSDHRWTTTVTLSRTIRCWSELRPLGGRNVGGVLFVNHLFSSKFNIIKCVGVAAPPSGEHGCSDLCWAHITGDLQKMKSRMCVCFHYRSSKQNMRQGEVIGAASKCKPESNQSGN